MEEEADVWACIPWIAATVVCISPCSFMPEPKNAWSSAVKSAPDNPDYTCFVLKTTYMIACRD